MSNIEDLENDAGTYLNVVRFSQPSNPDGFVVLYLRPNGRFLFLGYWRGYERTIAAGTWEKKGIEVRLKGNGSLSTDTTLGPEANRFERTFVAGNAKATPSLTASEELKGWSLLSATGPFVYVGQRTIIDPDGRWLPNSLSTVDELIEEVHRR